MAYPPRRPIGVAILALLVILAGALLSLLAVLAVLGGLLILGAGGGGLILAIAIVFLILALMLLGAGFGLWNLRPWAWWLAVLVVVLSLLGALGAYLADPEFGGAGSLLRIAIPFLILVYLLAVRGQFRGQPSSAR